MLTKCPLFAQLPWHLQILLHRSSSLWHLQLPVHDLKQAQLTNILHSLDTSGKSLQTGIHLLLIHFQPFSFGSRETGCFIPACDQRFAASTALLSCMKKAFLVGGHNSIGFIVCDENMCFRARFSEDEWKLGSYMCTIAFSTIATWGESNLHRFGSLVKLIKVSVNSVPKLSYVFQAVFFSEQKEGFGTKLAQTLMTIVDEDYSKLGSCTITYEQFFQTRWDIMVQCQYSNIRINATDIRYLMAFTGNIHQVQEQPCISFFLKGRHGANAVNSSLSWDCCTNSSFVQIMLKLVFSPNFVSSSAMNMKNSVLFSWSDRKSLKSDPGKKKCINILINSSAITFPG